MMDKLIFFLLLSQFMTVCGIGDYEDFNYYFNYQPKEPYPSHQNDANIYGSNFNVDPFGGDHQIEYMGDSIQFLGNFMKEKSEDENVEYVGETEKDKQKAIEVIKNNTGIEDDDPSDSNIVKSLYKIDAEKLVENTDGLFEGKNHLLSVVEQFRKACKKSKKKQPTDWDGEYNTPTSTTSRPAKLDYLGLLNKYPNKASEYLTWKNLMTRPTHESTNEYSNKPLKITYKIPRLTHLTIPRLTYPTPSTQPTPPPTYASPPETYPTLAPTYQTKVSTEKNYKRRNGQRKKPTFYYLIDLNHPRYNRLKYGFKNFDSIFPRKTNEFNQPFPCKTVCNLISLYYKVSVKYNSFN